MVEAEAENAALQARLRELARQLQAARGQLRAHGIAGAQLVTLICMYELQPTAARNVL